ncbi:hypothetical protein MLD38_029693 [Melastoma candidum]|uniref:Uncharacterized protein n=1 Tax=Melastoma candidum TaxID=119954 RepID=A0ACB9N4W6_9MYRT|nr:hypothetical protein MLD38_029693 [Melastoma candidum]
MPSASQVPPLLVVLLVVSLSLARSQDPTTSAPTVASCQPQLLSLVPCAPFVQATTPSPPQSCCDVLNQIYGQQPRCLCLLLNATNVVSIPINNTLALQLPRLCNIPADPSSCGSVPTRPPSRVSQLGSNSSRSVAGTRIIPGEMTL